MAVMPTAPGVDCCLTIAFPALSIMRNCEPATRAPGGTDFATTVRA